MRRLEEVIVLEEILQSQRLQELQARVRILYPVDDQEVSIVLHTEALAIAHLAQPFVFRISIVAARLFESVIIVIEHCI